MLHYLPAMFVMGFFTFVTGLVVAGATMVHRLLGRVVMVLAAVAAILLGFAPGMHGVIGLLSACAIFSCHTMMLPEARQRRAEEEARRAAAPSSSPALSAASPALPAPPQPTPTVTAPAEPRPAIPCPGCGAGTRPGGTCVYCGRHV